MGEVSDETKVGLVTYVDERYNYVWSLNLGSLELRFPINPGAKFEPGELVRYVQSHDGRSVQIFHNLLKAPEDLIWPEPVVRPPARQIKWKVRVKLTFAPTTSEQYKEIMEHDDEERVKAIAYSNDIQLCVSFVNLDFELGKVYKGWITRIPKAHDPLVRKLGTIFCIISKKDLNDLEEVTDPDIINEILMECPWKDLVCTDGDFAQDDDIGLPIIQNNENKEVSGPNNQEMEEQTHHVPLYEEEPRASNYAEELHNEEEGEQNIGLIVRCERDYSAIWSPTHDLVRVQLDEQVQNLDNPIWPLCTWVYYRCIEEVSQLKGGIRCQYTAYDIKRMNNQREVIQLNENVAAKMRLTNAKAHGRQYFIGYDKFFKEVLCSCQDRQLTEKMQIEDPNAFADIYAIYTDTYKTSKWVAFAVKDEDRWIKVNELPPQIDTEINAFFDYHCNSFDYKLNEQVRQDASLIKKFEAPSDWRGEKTEGDKIIDVLGLVTCFENENRTSVIATKYGIARQPTTMKLGTWVRATIVKDPKPSGENFMQNLDSFIVEYSKKIRPPISTRAVNHDGVTKLLICCNVTVGPNCLENEYLGKIEDPRKLINFEGFKYITSFLVEVCFSRHEQNFNTRYWKILKNHGESTKCVHTVALKLSHFPTAMGDTCDSAHTVLLDPVFDARKSYTTQNKILEPAARTRPISLRDLPTTSSNVLNGYTATTLSTTSKLDAPFLKEQSEQLLKNNFPQMSNTRSNQINGKSNMMSLSNSGYNCLERVKDELGLYVPCPDNQQKRAVGVVVTKTVSHAILYSQNYGNAILLPQYVQKRDIFDNFKLGEFVGVQFARVSKVSNRDLLYKWMCLPEFKPSRQLIETRVVLQMFVQFYIECDFRKSNIQLCTEDLNHTENEMKYCVETSVGRVLLSEEVVNENDLLGKVVQLWITHVHRTYGCYWRITHFKLNTQEEDNELDDLETIVDRIDGEIRTFSELSGAKIYPNISVHQSLPSPQNRDQSTIDNNNENGIRHASAVDTDIDCYSTMATKCTQKLLRSGYGDFLYGSHVPDVLSGECYHGERYCTNNKEDENEADVSDNESILSSSLPGSGDERAESVKEDQGYDFSDDSEAFERNLRILGGATPPLPVSRYAVAAANTQAQQVPRSVGSFGTRSFDEQQRYHQNISLMNFDTNLDEDLIQL